MNTNFKIAILGAGTVGLTFASCFEKSLLNYDILVKRIPAKPIEFFIGRDQGVFKKDKFISINEAIIVEKSFDLIISTVKRYDLIETIDLCSRILKPNGVILSLQNGIDIRKDYGVLGSQVIHTPIFIVSELLDNIIKIQQAPEIVLPVSTNEKIKKLLANSNITVTESLDIEQSIWRKMIFISSVSGVCSLLNTDIKGIRSNDRYYMMFKSAVDEAINVAIKEGIFFETDILKDTLVSFERLPDQFKPSMAYDFIHHRRSEINWLSGTISQLGRKLSIPVITHDTIFKMLTEHSK